MKAKVDSFRQNPAQRSLPSTEINPTPIAPHGSSGINIAPSCFTAKTHVLSPEEHPVDAQTSTDNGIPSPPPSRPLSARRRWNSPSAETSNPRVDHMGATEASPTGPYPAPSPSPVFQRHVAIRDMDDGGGMARQKSRRAPSLKVGLGSTMDCSDVFFLR